MSQLRSAPLLRDVTMSCRPQLALLAAREQEEHALPLFSVPLMLLPVVREAVTGPARAPGRRGPGGSATGPARRRQYYGRAIQARMVRRPT